MASLDTEVAQAFFSRFTELRPVQVEGIPAILAGNNVIISSGTGSGKTEAAVAPLINPLWREARGSDAMFLLYITPTKALANDIECRLSGPLAALGLRVGVRHGDRDDLRLRKPPHLLITTPESLDVLLVRNDPALNNVRSIVIDEVHLLYNTQRGLQLGILLQRLREHLQAPFQWVALSATLGDLSAVRDFLFGPSEAAVFLTCSTGRPIDAQIRDAHSLQGLADLCRTLTSDVPRKLLVFANSRRVCDRLADHLTKTDCVPVPVFAHYSSLSPSVRVKTERDFAAAAGGICIATSTLELGIDIGDIDAVLLWGAPNSTESFLQRIGRGCRRSAKSNVIGLIPDDESLPALAALKFLTLLETSRTGSLPARRPYHLYGAVAQQCLSILASRDGWWVKMSEFAAMVRGHEHLGRPVCEAIITGLRAADYLRVHDFKNQFGGAQALYRLIDYRMVYGNFPIASQTVEISHGSECLGDVPAINLLRIAPGDVVLFAGSRWRVQSADPERIRVEPTTNTGTPIDFRYGSRGPASDSSIINNIWRMIHARELPLADLEPTLKPDIEALCVSLSEGGPHSIPFFRSGIGTCYLTFAGSIVNKAISLISGQPVVAYDDVALLAMKPVDWGSVPTTAEAYQSVFPRLSEQAFEQSIFQSLLPHELQMREFLQSWLKDPMVPEVLLRLASSSCHPITVASARMLTSL